MIVKNKIVTIFGDPGDGKTLISLFFVSDYFLASKKSRIYANVNYFYKGKIINKIIKKIDDIEKIKYDDQKGLVVLDESGININSRRSMSDDNLEYSKLAMLGRKKNIDIIVIAQLDYSLDKYFRDLSFVSLYMKSYFYKSNYLKFEVDIYKKNYYIGKKELDLFFLIKQTFFSYSDLETSIVKSNVKSNENKKINKTDIKKIQNKMNNSIIEKIKKI